MSMSPSPPILTTANRPSARCRPCQRRKGSIGPPSATLAPTTGQRGARSARATIVLIPDSIAVQDLSSPRIPAPASGSRPRPGASSSVIARASPSAASPTSGMSDHAFIPEGDMYPALVRAPCAVHHASLERRAPEQFRHRIARRAQRPACWSPWLRAPADTNPSVNDMTSRISAARYRSATTSSSTVRSGP